MRTYTLTTLAYGGDAGDEVSLDETDPLVQLNVANGVLVAGKTKAQTMTCPICEATVKKPDDLAKHYADKHAAYAVPGWVADDEGKVK
jgi:hypothetical protein